MNKERRDKIKSKLKEHAPDIILGTFAASVATTIVILAKFIAEQEKRFPEGEVTQLALNKESFDKMVQGEVPYWIIKGHEINVAYDPDC